MGRYGGDYWRGHAPGRSRGQGFRADYEADFRGGYDAGWRRGGSMARERPYYPGESGYRGRGGGRGYGGYGGFGTGPSHARGGAGWGWEGSEAEDVDRIRAAEIMTPNPDAASPDTPVAEIARRMRDLDVGVIPIVQNDDDAQLLGVVTDRDIAIRLAAEGKDAKKTQAREVMSTDVQSVSESDHVRDVFAVMKRARVRRVPVVDAQGKLVGIISQADLAVNYAGLSLQRETEVEEVIERISEPARPRWGREAPADDRRRPAMARLRGEIEQELPQRVRDGWRTLRREARNIMRRGYDRGWR